VRHVSCRKLERKVNKHQVDSLCIAKIVCKTDRNKENLEQIDEMNNYSASKMVGQHVSLCTRFLEKCKEYGD
jgi:hypothetical protein